jgi:two-component system phosphate regulon sensor histidine kinase PhoR
LRVRLSFQGWLLGGFVLVVICTLAFMVIFLQNALRDRMVGQIRDDLHQQLVLLREIVSDRWTPSAPSGLGDRLANELGGSLGLRVTLIRPDGVVLGDSEVAEDSLPSLENHAARPEVHEALEDGEGWSLRYSATLGLDLLYAARLLGKPGDPRMVLRLAIPLTEVQQSLSKLRRVVMMGSLLGVILAIGLAYMVSRYISGPVKDLTRTVKRITSGDLSPRLQRYPRNEIGDLGRAFDQMADYLQREIQAVARERDRFEAILRGMEEGVMLVDRNGRIVLVNPALHRILDPGLDPSGRRPTEVFRNADLQEAMNAVLGGEKSVTTEVRILGAHPRTLEVHVVSLPGEDMPGGAVAVFHDITERKRLDEVRRDFVANVSHELKTPLTAIRGSVETLQDGALDDQKHARHFLEVIQRHIGRLEGLLDDLLNLAKIESGEASPRMEEIDLQALFEDVMKTVTPLALGRGIDLVINHRMEGVTIKADRHQLERALLNLLDNGIKYTESGGQVQLGVCKNNHEMQIIVSDSGIGILSEQLPRIFERFYRVDKARSREQGGTGLGLAIVKHIAQAHGGRVEVESRLGRGSTFRLILPA